MAQVRPLLAIVPVSLRTREQLDPVARCLVSLSSAAPAGLPIVVAAGSDSDPELLDHVAVAAAALGGELVRSPSLVTLAVNAGLEGARDAGADALLVAQDVELSTPGWLEALRGRTDTAGRPAAVVGGRLLHGGGLIAHAGMFFSMFFREWHRRYLHAPAQLPAALVPTSCPVAADLQLVRHETLERVGVHDPELLGDFASVDYCLRAFAAGLECIYEPTAVAAKLAPLRFEGPAPDADLAHAYLHLRAKHRATDFGAWIPALL